MSEKYTIGRYVLVILALFIGFSYIVSLSSWYFGLIDDMVGYMQSVMGSGGVLSTFLGFLLNMLLWYIYIFETPIPLAVIIVIALVYEAFESRWR